MGLFIVIENAFTDPSIFNTASPQAERIGSIGNGFLIAASAILLLVIVLAVFIVIRFRERPGTQEPNQVSGNRKLEIAMVGVPTLLVIAFFFWSVNTMSAVMPGHGKEQPDIVVTGHQWWWQVNYRSKGVITANEIHLPVGRRVLLELRSADVIHDWWVPSLGAKMDMIPGSPNYLWLTAGRTGIFQGACSEFCGQQHAWMRIRVIAEPWNDYQAWLATQKQPPVRSTDSIANIGQALFMHASCSSCHRIAGTPAAGTEGPDLTHFNSRKTMLAGLMSTSPEHIKQWLEDPQKIKPGAHMPRFIFGPDSIKAITAYLTQLK